MSQRFLLTAAFVLLLGFGATSALRAQSDTATDALKLRADLSVAIAKGDLNPQTALGQLRAHASPSGLKTDRDAGFAFAAIDVGQRLISARKPAQAELFFREAEPALVAMVQKTSDSAAAEKAMYLQQLARVRLRFLNKVAEAKADLAEAIKLQPEDKNLQRFRNDLLKDQAEIRQVRTTKS